MVLGAISCPVLENNTTYNDGGDSSHTPDGKKHPDKTGCPEIQHKQASGRETADQELRSSHSPTRKLDVDQTVVTQDYGGVNRWVLGVIIPHSGPLFYEVRVAPNTVWW